jgi:hypothetical protein
MGISLTGIIDGIYWVIIALFVLVNLISLRLTTRPIRFSVANHSTALLFNLVAFVAYLMLMNIGASFTFAIVFALAGIVLGFGIGALSKVYSEDGVMLLKRSVSCPLLVLVAYVASIYFAAFGGENLMSFGMLLVVAATGLSLGSGITEAFRATKQRNPYKPY